jgi:phosphoribosylanthranilate isomerase
VTDATRRRPLCVKVCGITRQEDAQAAIEAGADLLGFNFYPTSPRYITPADARPIVRTLPRHVLAVGIFVDADADTVAEAIALAGIKLLQLHGAEPPEFCRAFVVPAIKALKISRLADLASAAAPYSDGWVLADTADSLLHGGTGRALSVEPVDAALARRLFVAGGLCAESVVEVVRCVRPLGVDVCSGVELEPGRKDHHKLRSFVANAKAA